MKKDLSELGERALKRALEDLATEEGRSRLEDGMIHAHRMCIYLFEEDKIDLVDVEWFMIFMKKACDEFYPDA